MDPTGAFDCKDFFSGFADMFSSREHKYSKFYDYNIERFINSEEYDYYTNTPGALPTGKKTFYRSTIFGFEYCIAFKTEFGKLTKNQKLNAIDQEYQKLLKAFEEFKDDYFGTVKDLGYGLGESLFNIAQNSSPEELIQDFVLNNFETIADLAQVDIDGINILRDLNFLKRRFNEVLEDE